MRMHNPPNPGAFITEVYLESHGLRGRELAANPGVAASALSRVVRGVSGFSQDNYHLWQAKRQFELRKVRRMRFTAA